MQPHDSGSPVTPFVTPPRIALLGIHLEANALETV